MALALRPRGREIWASLTGIALLSVGQARGIGRFAEDMGATRRSFLSLFLALPLFLVLRLSDWLAGRGPLESPHAMGIDILSFAVGWPAYLLISHAMARQMGQERRWPRYVTAWNWCNVAQYLLLVAASVPTLLGAPPILSQTAALVGFGWALWLEWYVAKLALDTTAVAAILLVVLDLSITLALGLLATLPNGGISLS